MAGEKVLPRKCCFTTTTKGFLLRIWEEYQLTRSWREVLPLTSSEVAIQMFDAFEGSLAVMTGTRCTLGATFADARVCRGRS